MSKLSVLTFHADLSWALDRCPTLKEVDRGSFNGALVNYEWLLKDFERMLALLTWEQRAQVALDLVKRLTTHKYEERVLADVLNASGATPQDIEAYRLSQKAPSSLQSNRDRRL